MKGALKGVCIGLLLLVVVFSLAFTIKIHPLLPIAICCTLVVILFAYLFYEE